MNPQWRSFGAQVQLANQAEARLKSGFDLRPWVSQTKAVVLFLAIVHCFDGGLAPGGSCASAY